MNISLDEWEDLEPEAKTGSSAAPVRFGVSEGKTGRRRGRVLMRRAVIDQLDLKTWRANVRIGRAANRFRLAVVPNTDGRFELQEMGKNKGGGTWRILLPVIDTWTDFPMPLAEPDWSIGKIFGRTKALFIELPAPLVCADHYRKWQSARSGA